MGAGGLAVAEAVTPLGVAGGVLPVVAFVLLTTIWVTTVSARIEPTVLCHLMRFAQLAFIVLTAGVIVWNTYLRLVGSLVEPLWVYLLTTWLAIPAVLTVCYLVVLVALAVALNRVLLRLYEDQAVVRGLRETETVRRAIAEHAPLHRRLCAQRGVVLDEVLRTVCPSRI